MEAFMVNCFLVWIKIQFVEVEEEVAEDDYEDEKYDENGNEEARDDSRFFLFLNTKYQNFLLYIERYPNCVEYSNIEHCNSFFPLPAMDTWIMEFSTVYPHNARSFLTEMLFTTIENFVPLYLINSLVEVIIFFRLLDKLLC